MKTDNDSDQDYFINSPVFFHYKKRCGLFGFRAKKYLKSVYINERIIEIPFAISSVSRLPSGVRVLDLGCSESDLSLQLSGLGYKVTGFDFRKYPYLHPNLHVVQGDILHLPFAAGSFDAVLSISTLEHVGIGFYHDPRLAQQADEKAVAEIQRVLSKGGMLVLTVPFGRPQGTQHQRIYHRDWLETLLKNFLIQEMRYFGSAFSQQSRGNFWREITLEEAARVCSGESVQCVGVIRAVKSGA